MTYSALKTIQDDIVNNNLIMPSNVKKHELPGIGQNATSKLNKARWRGLFSVRWSEVEWRDDVQTSLHYLALVSCFTRSYFKLRAKRPVWKLRNDSIQNLSVCLYVCLSVRPSVCQSVCLLSPPRLLEGSNWLFRGRKHCYYINFKVICEKLVSHISHIFILKSTGDTVIYLLPPFLPPTSYLSFYRYR